MTREPQQYDTLAKKGLYWRVMKVEGDTLTARRISGADYKPKTGRALVGTWDDLQKRGFRLCDFSPVTVVQEGAKKEPESVEEPKEAQQVAAQVIEAEEAEQLVEDSRKINFWFRAFRCKLTTGREYTVRVKEYMTVQDAIYRMAQGRFVEAEDGSWFSTELIESVRPVKG